MRRAASIHKTSRESVFADAALLVSMGAHIQITKKRRPPPLKAYQENKSEVAAVTCEGSAKSAKLSRAGRQQNCRASRCHENFRDDEWKVERGLRYRVVRERCALLLIGDDDELGDRSNGRQEA
jgi:hypothetical protein